MRERAKKSKVKKDKLKTQTPRKQQQGHKRDDRRVEGEEGHEGNRGTRLEPVAEDSFVQY